MKRHAWIIIITLMAGNALAQYSGGTGTPEDPYKIANKADLLALAATPGDYGKCFELTADISLSGESFTSAIIAPDTVNNNANYNFEGTAFTGVFDGAGYRISDASINSGIDAKDYVGLFGKIGAGGQVKNLVIEYISINSSYDSTSSYSYYYGGLCGYSCGSVTNCAVFVPNIRCQGNGRVYGGICGQNDGTITNCQTVGGSITDDHGMYLGGLCGWNKGQIYYCSSETAVDGGANTFNVGGFCGANEGTIKFCYATGAVAAQGAQGNPAYCSDIGGLCGINWSGTIESCYATGAVTGTYSVTGIGAFCGTNRGAGIIRTCYGTGDVTAGAGSVSVAGFCGRIFENGSTIANCFWDTQTTGMAVGYTTSGGAIVVTNLNGRTTALMQTQSTFTNVGWQFVPAYEYKGAWYSCDNHYPTLSWGPDQTRPFMVTQKTPESSYYKLKLELTCTTSTYDFLAPAMFILQNGEKIYQPFASWALQVPDDYGFYRMSYYTSQALLPGVYDIAVSFSYSWPNANHVLLENALFIGTDEAVSKTASVQVRIEPAEAVGQGAQWRIKDGSWNDANTVGHADAGIQSIEFCDLQFWKEPQAQEVVVYANQEVGLEGRYEPLSVYKIDELSDMSAWHGDKLEFVVSGDSLGMALVTGPNDNPAPVNSPVFEPSTGYFSYVPADQDVFPFHVKFTGITDGVAAERTIAVFPIARLSNEYVTIERDYDPIFGQEPIVEVYEQPPAYMNGVAQAETKDVHIIGNEVDSSVLAAFDGDINIRSVSIYAQRLTISQEIHVGQANFNIYAEELTFESGGKINTAAINCQSPPVNVDGLAAGDIVLHCQFVTNNAASPIFVLSGEDAPGAGRGGAGGNVISTIPLDAGWIDNAGGASAAGKYSVDGQVATSGSVLEWLHPLLLKEVLAKARNLYMEEMYEEAYGIACEYSRWLVSYQRDFPAQFQQLPADLRRQLCESQAEFDALARQLNSGLDYFGNLRDWVPMLSFEVSTLAFSQEVERALSVFYLCRWVEDKNGSLVDQKNAVEQLRSQAMDRIQLLRQQYSVQVNDIIPALNEKLVAVGQEQYEKQQELNALQVSLTNTVQTSLSDREKVFAFLKGAKFGASIGSKICGALSDIKYVGIAFGITGAIADIAGEGITFGTEMYDQVSAYKPRHIEEYAGMSQQWSDALDGIDLANVNDFLDTYTQDYQQLSLPAADELGLSEDFASKIRAPKDEVEKELARLADQMLGPYLDDLNRLVERRATYSRQMICEVCKAQAMAGQIGYNLTAIEQFDAARLELAGKLNPAVVQFVRDMKNRARDTLNKYAYYLARAYEYRMLKPYPGEINLAMLDDEVGQFTWDPNDSGWSTAMMAALEAAYKEDLYAVCSSIYDDYASSPRVERSSYAILELTPEEIDLLNSGQKVQVNLIERGLFFPQEEAVRLTSINVRQAGTTSRIEGASSGSEVCKIRVEHSGRSQFRYDGQVYAFTHYNAANEEPIYWQAKHITDGGSVNEWYQENRSFASDSLLYTLLSRDGTVSVDPDDIMFYSRPAAWAQLVISKEDMPGRTAMVVYDTLAFDISYDYYARTNSTVNVGISSTIDTHIKVSTADNNGRQDGYGSFTRVYPAMMDSGQLSQAAAESNGVLQAEDMAAAAATGQIVQATAPLQWGAYVFQKWTDSLGNDYGFTPANPSQFIFLYDDISLVARYRQDLVSITGTVMTDDGLGAPGLTIVDQGDETVGFTDEYGSFNVIVDYGFSGTLRPVCSGKTFTPVSRTYNEVSENLDGQDFVIQGYDALAAPEGLSASHGTNYSCIVLNWQSAGPDVLYRVYRSTSPQDEPVPVCAWQEGTTFVDTQCYHGRYYVYVVRAAVDDVGRRASPYSLYDVGWLAEAPNAADFDEDGCVDLSDYSALAGTWLLEVGDAGYNSGCDLQHDNKIDSTDLGMFASNWLDGAF